MSHIIDLKINPRIHHDVAHVDSMKDNATVFYLEFDEPHNWLGDSYYTKKYNKIIKAAWRISEEKNLVWNKFDVDIYPVIK